MSDERQASQGDTVWYDGALWEIIRIYPVGNHGCAQLMNLNNQHMVDGVSVSDLYPSVEDVGLARAVTDWHEGIENLRRAMAKARDIIERENRERIARLQASYSQHVYETHAGLAKVKERGRYVEAADGEWLFVEDASE